jgi:hypothetical protein
MNDPAGSLPGVPGASPWSVPIGVDSRAASGTSSTAGEF